jgi:hypothetical protein
VEVQQRVGGLAAADAVLVAEAGDGVGESGALLGGVDLLVDVGECVPGPVGVVVFKRFAQALEVRADQSWEGDEQREVERGEIEQLVAEVLERVVGEPVEFVDRLMAELGEVRAGELLV